MTAARTTAIMQPYFLPYLGYFQLIAAVDVFVVYDDIKYTKKGWINRNRLLQNGRPAVFSLPLRHASDALDVRDRELAAGFRRDKLLNKVAGAYGRAPFFAPTFALFEELVRFDDRSLFGFIEHSLRRTCAHLGIATEVRRASEVAAHRGLKGQDKVLALCEAVGTATYVNPIGGVALYSPDAFARRGIALRFLRPLPFEYAQFGDPFVPWLSILDVLMFNPLETVRERLSAGYELVEGEAAAGAGTG